MNKKNYVLDSQSETERLDRQSKMKAFSFSDELQFLKTAPGQKILDAGCGSGIVSDYLSRQDPQVEVVACDFSKDRVDEARAKYGTTKNIKFIQQNLLEMDKSLGSFDTIVCRYVLRHFNSEDGKKVITNLFNALKPGGTLYCIDVEGVMGDIYPASDFLRESLRKIRESKAVDFQIARKLPVLLLEHGFESVDWKVLLSEFKGESLAQEISNLKQSVKNAESFAKQMLGGDQMLERFKEEYFSTLSNQEGLVFFYNRVVAFGTKPKSSPKLRLVTSNS